MADNAIVLENMLAGSPRSEWDPLLGESDNIQGFATNISVNHGDTIDFKIDCNTGYSIQIYRLGYYGGDGARLITTINDLSGFTQPDPLVDGTTGLVDAGNWEVSASWSVPEGMTSGVFLATLVRDDGTGVSHIPFIVRADESSSDIVFQTSDTTWQAYNTWGSQNADGDGANLYGGDAPPERAYAVSYNRPIVTRTDGEGGPNPYNFILGPEFSAIYWLEQNGYDVSYIAGVDTDRDGSSLLDHQVFLTAGHDEYWSGQQRANVEAARDAGVNLAFLTGNEMYWRVRWEDSIDGSGTPYRTLVCYKESFVGDIDPSNEWTGTFRDGRFTSPTAVGGGIPENAVTGTMFGAGNAAPWFSPDATISVPYDMSQYRFWRNTSIAETQAGESSLLGDNLLKYEFDISPDNEFRPAGLIPLSSTTLTHETAEVINDYGNASTTGTTTHSLMLYRDLESGALVFGAGAVFWSWGLGGDQDVGTGTQPSRDVQQAMVNLLADMGVQPVTLQGDLVPASATDDYTPPNTTIVGIQDDLSAASLGQLVVFSGTATDDDGDPSTPDGRIAAVEVSTNGGVTWRRAEGTTSWTYSWVAQDLGDHIVMARAVDDSLNMQYLDVPRVDFSVIPINEVVGTAGGGSFAGGDGQDWIYGSNDGSNELVGGKGNDFLFGGAQQDWLYGESGINDIHGGTGNDFLYGGYDQDFLYGDSGLNELNGGMGNDLLIGGVDQDWLYAGDGNDRLEGGDGNDFLFGGTGRDELVGGAGSDVFVFTSLQDTSVIASESDIIVDFEQGNDLIDLSALSELAIQAGAEGLTFAGAAGNPFSVWTEVDATNDLTTVAGDVTGDGSVDFQIRLTGQIGLSPSDFVLSSSLSVGS